jgi:hypothetical protein
MRSLWDWCACWYFGIRCVPSMVRHCLGRWHVFRNEPDWLVELLADVSKEGGGDTEADDALRAYYVAAAAEWALRERRAEP